MTVWIFIPVRDEESGIAAVITAAGEELRRCGLPTRFVVVNDGSTDTTIAQAQATPFAADTEIISQPPLGVGAAFNRGINAILARAADDDALAILEGDGTSATALLPEMLRQLTATDVVIASRYLPGGGYRKFSVSRQLLSRIANLLLRWRYRLRGVTDYTIFFRCYRIASLRKSVVRYGELRYPGFEANTELLLRCARLPVRFAELPFMYDYGDKCSRSKMRVGAAVYRHVQLLLTEDAAQLRGEENYRAH